MSIKLGNSAKHKLTTLAILSVIAGVGHQVDTAQADTTGSGDDNNGTENTGVAPTANDINSNEEKFSNSQSDGASGPADSQKDGSQGEDSVGDTEEDGVVAGEQGNNGETIGTHAQKDGNESGITGAPGGPTNPAKPAPNPVAAKAPAPQLTTPPTPAPQVNAAKSKSNLMKVAVAPVVQTGTWGTSAWSMDDQGVMTIKAGTLGTSLEMAAVKGNVTKVIFDSGFILPWKCSQLFNEWTKVQSYEGLANVDASKANVMVSMFAYNFALESIDLSSWDMSKVNNMLAMFQGPNAEPEFSLGGEAYMHLTSVKMGDSLGKTSVNIAAMFEGDKMLTSVDAANWDVSKINNMADTFNGTGFTSLDLSNWQLKSNLKAINAFGNMYNLTSLNLAGWNLTGNVASIFANDVKLSSLDLTNFAGSGVYHQVYGMTGLKQLTLGPNNAMATQGHPEWMLGLPEITPSDDYTGLWQFVGTGTVDKPNGPTYTAAELMAAYDGATMAGTYVWQKTTPKPTTPTNPGTDTGNTTNPTTPDVDNTTDPVTPETNGDVVTGGDGATIDGSAAAKVNRAKKTTRAVAKKAVKRNTTKSNAPTTVVFAKADKQARATQLGQPATKQQSQKTTLPQTGEQQASGWWATLAGVIGLSLLSLNWFKRQS
ncbi:BspA family leucine-rich repeat surface protein [Levilactobacillus sp. N40-8-2]|uniref:BspA family leucine-rich repeat surface protein n=1 Tax=Levilactobacillus muriae TaxID=3238987 RepID=UPI0038B3A69E